MTPFKRSLVLQVLGLAVAGSSVVLGDGPLGQMLGLFLGLGLWAAGMYLTSRHLQSRIDGAYDLAAGRYRELSVLMRGALPRDPAARRRFYEGYAHLHEDMSRIFEREPGSRQRCEELLAATVGQSLLEVGCSTGGIVARGAQAGYRAVGLDLSRHALRLGEPGVRYVQGDALHLPFADGAFDTVLLPEVLEHLHEPVAALAEAARVARRRVVASLPLGPDSDPTHVTEYERASALALFAGVAGLAVTATGMVGTWLIVTAEPATDC